MKKTPKNAENFECRKCTFKCSKKSEWSRHLSTRKHNLETNGNKMETGKNAEIFCCLHCAKSYATRTGLWKHGKRCKNLCSDELATDSSHITPGMLSHIMSNLKSNFVVDEIVKQNMVMAKQNIELSEKVLELSNARNVTNNTTTNNTQFNMNFFLNEKCKDAINFTDFIKSIILNQSDLQTVVKHGHVDGTSKIICDMFNGMGVYNRPIHCMDVKRETVYIRENDEWEKEDNELPRIQQLANTVTHKVLQQSTLWHKENPDYMDSVEKKEESLQIMSKAFGNENGGAEQNQKKIMKIIINQLEVDKESEKMFVPKKIVPK